MRSKVAVRHVLLEGLGSFDIVLAESGRGQLQVARN
jgi:hypothetical protein